MTKTVPDLRTDDVPLRSPVMLPDGSLRVDAISATAGEVLTYPWGKEVVTREALSDPAYLDAMRGVAVTRHHIKGGRVTVKNKAERVGTVTSARFDEDAGVAIREMSLFDEQVIADVLSGKLSHVSETYDAPKAHRHLREDGITEQRKRIPNSIALTDNPRAKSATIRNDEADMNEDEIKALIAGQIKPLADAVQALTTKVEGLSVQPVAEPAGEPNQDSADDIAERIVALRLKATEMGVDCDGVKGEAALATHIAAKLGADSARCDDLSYCHGFIAAQKAPETKADTKWPTLRTDSTTTPKLAV